MMNQKQLQQDADKLVNSINEKYQGGMEEVSKVTSGGLMSLLSNPQNVTSAMEGMAEMSANVAQLMSNFHQRLLILEGMTANAKVTE